jgi:kynurenine formamidase
MFRERDTMCGSDQVGGFGHGGQWDDPAASDRRQEAEAKAAEDHEHTDHEEHEHAHDPELRPEPLMTRDGVSVSASPWGPDDEIGRLNWITPESRKDIIEHLDGRAMFDLSVELFMDMPTWVAAGDPSFQIFMTHTPNGSVLDNLSGAGAEVHRKYSYSGDSILMYSHTGTHMDLLNHLGFYGLFWNGWTTDKYLGSRHWMKGGPDHYPPIVAHSVLVDVAGMHGVDCLPDAYAVTPKDIKDTLKWQGTKVRKGDIVAVRTGRMTKWPDADAYMENSPGIGLAAAKYLAEDLGAMCVGADTIGVEVIPHEEPDTFLPVHCYMFATAGAQIIENLWLEDIAQEKQYEFAFIGFPLKVRGSTGGLMRPVAIPLRA